MIEPSGERCVPYNDPDEVEALPTEPLGFDEPEGIPHVSGSGWS